MPSSSQNNYLRPNTTGKNFNVVLTIGKEDITKFVRSIRIVDSYENFWPSFAIGLLIDPNNIILQDIYGQKEIILRISLNAEDGQTIEQNTFHLLYLQENVNLTPRTQQSQNQAELAPTNFACVPIFAVNLMGSFVNFVHEEEDGLTRPTDLVREYLTTYGYNHEIDDRNELDSTISQIIVPQMSFKQFMVYLHRHFGLYMGPVFYNCDAKGKFRMWDTSKRATDAPKFTVYQMPAGGESSNLLNKIFKKANPDKTLVTRDNIETTYFSNAVIMKYAYDIVEVIHPDYALYNLTMDTIQDIAETYGIFAETKQLEYNKILRTRKKYYYSTAGNRGNDVITMHNADSIMRSSRIQLMLRRNIRMKTVFNIGEPCIFEPTVVEHLRYRGKYILETVDYQLSRLDSDNWDAQCILKMFRTSNKQ